MDPDEPSHRVLFNPEMLLTIMKRMTLGSVLACRQVCRKWRSVSMLALKPLIQAEEGVKIVDAAYENWGEPPPGEEDADEASTDEEDSWISTRDGFYLWTCHEPYQRVSSFVPSPKMGLTIDAAPIRLDRGPQKRPRHKKMVHLAPWFIAVSLEVDWLSLVSRLTLDSCVTVDDWNAVGKGILKKFTSLVKLKIKFSKFRSPVLALCYNEIVNEETDLVLESLRKVEVYYTVIEKVEEIETFLRHLWDERHVWKSGVNWDFLRCCPNFQKFKGVFAYDSRDRPLGRCSFAEILMGRYRTKSEDEWTVVVNDKHHSIKTIFGNRKEKDPLPAKYNRIVAEDINALIDLTRPESLKMAMQLEVLSNLTPSAGENLQSLVLDSSNMRAHGPPSRVLPALSRTTGLQNVKCLTVIWNPLKNFPIKVLGAPTKKTLGSEPAFPNLVTLKLDRGKQYINMIKNFGNEVEKEQKLYGILDTWLDQKVHTMAPNVQVLIANFFYQSDGQSFEDSGKANVEDRAKVLKLAKSFPKLKHLVLVIDQYNFSDNAELSDDEVEGLQGLESLTIFLDTGTAVEDWSMVFLHACSMVPTMKKVEIYVHRDDDEDKDVFDEVDTDEEEILNCEPRIPIPEHLKFEIGLARTLDLDLEADFDGVENSYITWRELLTYYY